ncbi:hypothetical protein QQ045_019995 [Rhodiola kirilowii]
MAMLMQTLSLDQLGSNGGLEIGGLRDPSFSSYLSGAEEGFVLALVKQSCGGKAAAAADDDDGEIGVFGAEKYFNESLDDDHKKPKVDDELKNTIQKVQHRPIQSKAVSERSGSSWNSQIALLQRSVVVKNPSLNGGGKVRGRGCYLGISSFRCRCVCSDKNSVAVEEYESCGDILTQSHTKEPLKEAALSPVIPCMLNQGLKRETYSIFKDSFVEHLPLKPRKSLEVFGHNLPFSFGTEKRLMLNWGNESDISDASSDLFEIEDFTGRKVLNSGSATPTGNYAPSEASIAWSVVTADNPITSAYEEFKRSGKNTTNSGKTGSTLMNKKVTATSGDKPRRLSSSFLACNSHDSVKVIEEVHRAYEKIPDTKIIKPQTTEAKLTGLFEPGRTNVQQLGISSRALALSNSIHGSKMLYLK